MPDSKLSELPDGGAIAGTEIIESVQGGSNVKYSMSTVKTFVLNKDRGTWNTTDALPTNGSGPANAIRKYDRWIIPAGGWTYSGQFFPQWSILEAMVDGATTFDQFKYPY